MATNDIKVYSEMLDEIFLDYKGKYEFLLQYIPPFFRLLQKIYVSPDLTWEAKFKINACFSYFAIPEDVIPDSDGAEGFIDDLFICTYVLYEIGLEYPHLLQSNWEFDEDILYLIEEVLDQTDVLLGDKRSIILNATGLLKFDALSSSFNLFKTSMNIDEKIEMIDYEIQELTNLLRTILICGKSKKIYKTFQSIKESFDVHEWETVQDVIEKIKEQESVFDYAHEIELEEIRRNIILGLEEVSSRGSNGETI